MGKSMADLAWGIWGKCPPPPPNSWRAIVFRENTAKNLQIQI